MLTTLRLACLRVCLLALLLLSSPTQIRADDAYRGQGLAHARNFQPVSGAIIADAQRIGGAVAKGRLCHAFHVSESATILQEANPGASGVLKLNQLRPALDLRYGIFTGTELGLEIATLSHHSGGLDGLITATEALVDRPAPIRARLKGAGFAYVIARNGRPVLQGTNGAYGLADTTLSAKTLLVAERSYLPAIAVRVALKLPTGDQSRAFGTGLWNVGVGLAIALRHNCSGRSMG